MSLLDEAMETCVMLDRTTTPDGYGGIHTTYVEGASFKAALVLDSSIDARIAEVQGVTSLYTVTTGREITLHYHDVFKRDGKYYRVTSDGEDKKTPASATLNMRQVTAEHLKELPKNG